MFLEYGQESANIDPFNTKDFSDTSITFRPIKDPLQSTTTLENNTQPNRSGGMTTDNDIPQAQNLNTTENIQIRKL